MLRQDYQYKSVQQGKKSTEEICLQQMYRQISQRDEVALFSIVVLQLVFQSRSHHRKFQAQGFIHRFGICSPQSVEWKCRCMTNLKGSLRHGELLTVELVFKSPTKICLYQNSFSTELIYSLNFSHVYFIQDQASPLWSITFFFQLNAVIFFCVIWAVITWLKYNILLFQWYFKNYSIYLLLYNLSSLFILRHNCPSTSIKHCSHSDTKMESFNILKSIYHTVDTS